MSFVPFFRKEIASRVIDTSIKSAFVKLGYVEPTQDQQQAIKEFVKGKDVLVCLPTGAGKSLCFAAIPLVFDFICEYLKSSGSTKVLITVSSIVLVLSPLIALMKDQVKKFNNRNIKCTYYHGLQDSTTAGIVSGSYQLVYLTPESLLLTELRDMLLSAVYIDNLVGLAVDEAHCIDIW